MEDIETLTKMANEAGEGAEEMTAEQLAAAQEKLRLLMNNYKSAGQGISIHFSVYLVAFVIIFGTVGFFAYKLFNSLRDKERKREEKKKLKEMKKKK